MNVIGLYVTLACIQDAVILLEALIVRATEGIMEMEYCVVS